MIPTRLAIALQYLAPQHALSKFAGWLSSRRWRWWKNWQINFLINRYGADLSAAVSSNLDDYPNFNSFFTRHLKPELRPIGNDCVAPVDGSISQIGDIQGDMLLQAKGFNYTLAALLGGAPDLASAFQNGKFATIYLAPKDYHRVHIPLDGTLRETIYIPGQLFSVNQQTVNGVADLFSRNERLVCIFDTKIGAMAVIFVGAMLVGNIVTSWDPTPATKSINRLTYPQGNLAAPTFKRGDELGYFTMGSTVILLFPHDKISWLPDFHENSPTKMGQQLANILSP
jgi:phosphatidylserine decarboxylase